MRYRLPYQHGGYAHAKGRNGWFVPRVVEYELTEHPDSTPLLTLRLYSRREAREAPLEFTLAVSDWEMQALAIQIRVNEQHRRRREHERSLTRVRRKNGHAS